MAAVNLAPTFGCGFQCFTTGGLPLNAGLIYTYAAGSTTPQATYTTSAGSVQNANPIVLDADGRTPNEVWFLASSTYRIDVKDSTGTLIKTYDNLGGIISSPTNAFGVITVTSIDGLAITTTTGTLTIANGETLSYSTGSLASTFTFDDAGGTSSSITMTWQKVGNFVHINIPSVTATTGAASTTLKSNTALQSAVRPAALQYFSGAAIRNNGIIASVNGLVRMNLNGTIDIFRDNASAVYTGLTVNTGMADAISFSYYLG